MKSAIQFILTIIIGILVHAIVTTVDLITMAFVAINKGVRVVYAGILRVINGEDYYTEMSEMTWATINYAYKSYVNKMYPSEIEL